MNTHVNGNIGFVDIHCHLLPAIDDGAESWRQMLAMARIAVSESIHTIITTPHQLGIHRQNHGQLIRQRTQEVQQRLDDENVNLRVYPGADVRIEESMFQGLKSGDVLTLADRGKHVLLELPHEIYFPLEPVLDALSAIGLTGILSHPERNRGLLRCREILGALVERGCLMQITASSLVGSFGEASQEFAEWMISQGLVHLAATDAHGDKSRRPLMRRPFDRIVELSDEETAWNLCARNGARVSLGESIPAGQFASPVKPWFGWGRARRRTCTAVGQR